MTMNQNQTPPAQQLSSHDQEILSRIFNQELFDTGKATKVSEIKFSTRQLTEDEKRSLNYEMKAIEVAETKSDFKEALVILDKAIEICPTYPSPYNNRAQVYRLLRDENSALKDLRKAIELSDEFPLVKRQSLCQRGWILHLQGDDDRAFLDFEEAGKLGSDEARKMAVACNPYAKLCNSIMQEMLENMYFSQPPASNQT